MAIKNYETVFIMTPVLSDTQMKETVDKFRKVLKSNGAELVHEENWGLKKLAYPIQKKSTGFYHLYQYVADGALIEKLEIEFKRDEKVVRFLTVSLDKYAVEYGKRRANGELKGQKKQKAD